MLSMIESWLGSNHIRFDFLFVLCRAHEALPSSAILLFFCSEANIDLQTVKNEILKSGVHDRQVSVHFSFFT